VRVRTPDEVATSAIDRFVKMTAQGSNVDSNAWKAAISAEARVFAQEILQSAAKIAGGRAGKAIIEALAEAAG
jgi:hypothetical protein